MNTRLTRIAILLALALVAPLCPVSADIYFYRDAQGRAHFTNVPYGPHDEKAQPLQLLGPDQQQPRQKPQLTLREAVSACRAFVREEATYHGTAIPLLGNEFDAYIRSSDDKVMTFGGSEDRFRFGKCMDEKGYPLDLPPE